MIRVSLILLIPILLLVAVFWFTNVPARLLPPEPPADFPMGGRYEEPKPRAKWPSGTFVSLHLTRVGVEKVADGDVRIDCELVLDNTAGRKIESRSNFHTPYGGLQVVVADEAGKVLFQEVHCLHLSPSGVSTHLLDEGRTEFSLGFPVRKIPGDPKKVWVRIVGQIDGIDRTLSTTTLPVVIPDR